jgi:hypothetical protein
LVGDVPRAFLHVPQLLRVFDALASCLENEHTRSPRQQQDTARGERWHLPY